MGGMGSGRVGGLRAATTNDLRKIDLAWLRRQGLLHPGGAGSLAWSRGGERIAEIRYETRTHGLRLFYRVAPRGGEIIEVDETIPFCFSAQPFGGLKTWFTCPSCGRRTRTLFGGKYFRCRRCQGLKFASQYEADYERAIEAANRIHEKLGDTHVTAFECDELPEKPKRMRWTTYRRLEADYQAIQRRWQIGILERFGPQALLWR